MWGTRRGWGKRMTSPLTPWLRGVRSTFLSYVRYQQRNNYFHKGAFLENSPPPKLFSWMLRATPDSIAHVILSLLIYVLEAHY